MIDDRWTPDLIEVKRGTVYPENGSATHEIGARPYADPGPRGRAEMFGELSGFL